MTMIDRLVTQVSNNAAKSKPVDIRIGSHWTIVVLERGNQRRAGLSSTLSGSNDDHHHGGGPPVKDAGRLLTYSTAQLAALAQSKSLTEASVGFATINALLNVDENECIDVNAADIVAERGAGRNIAVVGHFPFLSKLRDVANEMWVLELRPRADDLPASMAPEILPQADIVAITGTSLLNHTFDELIAQCRPDAFVVVLGATTPLSPLLFEAGVNAIAGTLVVDIDAALLSVSQSATFPQVRGKRLVTLFSDRR